MSRAIRAATVCFLNTAVFTGVRDSAKPTVLAIKHLQIKIKLYPATVKTAATVTSYHLSLFWV